jgi:UDPglucose--hexose-1-phosphate uridylyltransferase
VERIVCSAAPDYDPDCYLCPGNSRAGGQRNPPYTDTYVFDNDYAALLPGGRSEQIDEHGILVAHSERGVCRVVCFSPNHSLTLSRMDAAAIGRVVDAWTEQWLELSSAGFIRSVQIFENRGEMMGASNPHPHGQIWASESIPDELARETAAQAAFFSQRGGCLLCDYLALERRTGERLVEANTGFLAVVPFWAMWPFETLVIPARHFGSLDAMTRAERDAMAEILSRLTTRYDRLFDAPFPYTMGIHQIPCDGGAHESFHLHIHFYPPLLRSAAVRKFMVGFEMLGGPQRDITPEQAAKKLRSVSFIRDGP